MADDVTPNTATWMTYRAAGERMGLQPSAVAARARRGKWPKRLRNDTGEAEVLVPAEALDIGHSNHHGPAKPPGTQAGPAPAMLPPPLTADALQAALAPLQTMLDRETQDRRILQAQADALRDQLAAAQLDAAKATGAANTERAKREAIEARAADLQRQVEALEARQRRRWWRF